jgi:hypothetical protein
LKFLFKGVLGNYKTGGRYKNDQSEGYDFFHGSRFYPNITAFT